MAARKKVRGFKNNQRKIAARKGMNMKKAGAILASASRNASASAKRKNPRLKRVSAKKRGGRKRR
jgi:hypothetical protein